MVVVVLVLLGLIVLGVFFWFGMAFLVKAERDQKKAEQNADAILDAAFDGREDVTFAINLRTLKYETVVVGAKQRGYKLTHQAENDHGPHTLIFEKASAVED